MSKVTRENRYVRSRGDGYDALVESCLGQEIRGRMEISSPEGLCQPYIFVRRGRTKLWLSYIFVRRGRTKLWSMYIFVRRGRTKLR